ncbi:hypothetical protein B0H34DRAFT_647032 [Crassisporium funariophilum]|nr:hypothetical protein B0H34DRAFT_647032 [Crassisporium funariophilum]
MSEQEKQCRICYDGTEGEPELGRLIRPCLCKGSISYVHVRCLQKWRSVSSTKSAFFACPQCRYQYRFSRTRFVGIATNPVIVGGLSGLLFTLIVMMASYITTFFVSAFQEPTFHHAFYFVSPMEVAQDLITAAFRVLKDGELADILDDSPFMSNNEAMGPPHPRPQPGLLKRFIQRFIIGLPLIGAGSLVHMLISVQFLAPIQWLARYRGSRRRNSNSRDIAALIVVGLLIAGALRAFYKVYKLTQSVTKRVLLRAEDAILEVN